MSLTKAILKTPLQIDVKELSLSFPDYFYRGPFKTWINKELHASSSELLVFHQREQLTIKLITFLLFDDKIEDGFTSISSDYSPKELAVLFLKLPSKSAQALIHALQGTSLHIPTWPTQPISFNPFNIWNTPTKKETYCGFTPGFLLNKRF